MLVILVPFLPFRNDLAALSIFKSLVLGPTKNALLESTVITDAVFIAIIIAGIFFVAPIVFPTFVDGFVVSALILTLITPLIA